MGNTVYNRATKKHYPIRVLPEDQKASFEHHIEGGQPNGAGIVEPSDYREWYTDDRETHHRLVTTIYGPWIEGPSKGVTAP